jgi:DNA-binding FadR family transcriptional regulator
MYGEEIREALDRLSDLGLWVYQGAGSVVRITWRWSAWSQVLDALEGPEFD